MKPDAWPGVVCVLRIGVSRRARIQAGFSAGIRAWKKLPDLAACGNIKGARFSPAPLPAPVDTDEICLRHPTLTVRGADRIAAFEPPGF
jgi:hypothetical protein